MGNEIVKILSNIGWLFVDRILRIVVSLFVGIWIARYLGPDEFGIYSYASAFTIFFSAIAGLGLQGVVNRELVRKPDNLIEIFGTSIALILISGVLAASLSVLGMFLLRPEDRISQILVLIISGTFLFRFSDVFKAYYDSRVESKYIVYISSIAFIVSSGLKVVFILLKFPLIYFGVPLLVDAIIVTIGLFILIRNHRILISDFTFSISLAKRFLKDSYPLILASVMALLYMKIDQIMLREMVSDTEVGYYSVAVRLAEIWFFVPAILQSSTFPNIIKAKEISDDLFNDKLLNLYKSVMLFGYCIAIPTTFLASWIVPFLYGEIYYPASVILLILVWSVPFAGLGIARATLIYGNNWMKLHSKIIFVGCFINIALNYILIPYLGGKGAAIASLITHIYSGYLCCFVHKPLWTSISYKTKAIFSPIPKF